MWYQDWLIILSCFLRDINWIIVHCRRWTTCWSMSFEKQFSTACFVESNHFFLVILVILVILLTERILKMEVPMCPSVQFWVLYCWTFEISLLLNLWDSWLTCLFTAEPLNFIYCWTFEIPYCLICLLLNLWTLFTAEPLRFLSVDWWTFELYLLLNLWDFYLFTAEPLRSKETQRFSSKQSSKVQQSTDKNLKGSAVNKVQRFSSKESFKGSAVNR